MVGEIQAFVKSLRRSTCGPPETPVGVLDRAVVVEYTHVQQVKT